MSNITGKTSITIGLATVILTSLVGGGYVFGVSQGKYEVRLDDQEKNTKRIEDQLKLMTDIDVKLTLMTSLNKQRLDQHTTDH